MSSQQFLRQHRAWEDWAVMALGLAVALSPWVVKETTNDAAVINAAVVGFALMLLAELDLVYFRRWVVIGQLACGAWIGSSPVVFGYAGGGALRQWHLLAGLAVVLVGALELWQHRLGRSEVDRLHESRSDRPGVDLGAHRHSKSPSPR